MATQFLRIVMLAALVAPAAGQSSAQPSQSPDDGLLAQVGDRRFTAVEVDASWKASMPTDHAQAMQRLYDGRRTALDRLLGDFLIERAARSKGVSAEQYEADEISRRARPVTDEQVAGYYRDNRDQMEGRSLLEMRSLLREFLEDRERAIARAALVTALKDAEPGFRDLLEPPRRLIELSGDDPSDGPPDAPVTVAVFADFQCPFCRELVPTLRRLREAGPATGFRLVWKDFPLTTIHRDALGAAEAAHCANEQGRFWEFHDRLFANQQQLRRPALKQHAADLGLDTGRFNLCVDGSRYAPKVRGSWLLPPGWGSVRRRPCRLTGA